MSARFFEAVTDAGSTAGTYGNFLAGSGVTVTASNVRSGFAIASVYNDLLGRAVQLEHSFTIYDTGARQNNKIDFDVGAGEVTITLTAGHYTGTTLASHISTLMTAAGLSQLCTYGNSDGKFLFSTFNASDDILWESGTNGSSNADLSAATTLGFDDSADDTGDVAYRSDSIAPVNGDGSTSNMGHWFKVVFPVAMAPTALAMHTVLSSSTLASGAVPDGTPGEIGLRVYSHTDNTYGDKIGDWVDNATAVGDFDEDEWVQEASRDNFTYDLRTRIVVTAPTARTHWMIHLPDTGAGGSEIPTHARVHYMWFGVPTTITSGNISLRPQSNSSQPLIIDGGNDRFVSAAPMRREPTFDYRKMNGAMHAALRNVIARNHKKNMVIVPDAGRLTGAAETLGPDTVFFGRLQSRIPWDVNQYSGTTNDATTSLTIREAVL